MTHQWSQNNFTKQIFFQETQWGHGVKKCQGFGELKLGDDNKSLGKGDGGEAKRDQTRVGKGHPVRQVDAESN